MKKEQGVLQDVIGTSPPGGESKIKKYLRIALAGAGVALFVLVIVMAALRRYGG